MRRFLNFFAVAIPAANASTCATSGAGSFMETGTNWYRVLTYCAYPPGSRTHPDDFYGCLNAIPNSIVNGQPVYSMGASLATAFNTVSTRAGLPSDCFRCAYDFALAAHAAFTNVDTGTALISACTSTAYWTASSVETSECQWGLYDAITAFNSCSGNGFDIVTQTASTRCTAAEFITFSIAHNPLSAIAECTFDDTSITSAAAIGNCVGSSYVADKASLGCESCFDPLMTGIQALSASCGTAGVFNYGSCTGSPDLHDLNEAFGSCSGGMTFDDSDPEAHCSADQMRVITAMRPYTNAMACAFPTTGNGDNCLQYYNSVGAALDELEGGTTVCSGYLVDLANNFQGDTTDLAICQTTPFAAACTDLIDNVYGLLYEAEVSIGMEIDTTSTMCSSAQWNAMTSSDKSYIPFVRCAMKSTSPADVLDCIEGDSLLTNVLAAPCASCFAQLAIEAYVARQSDASGLTDVLCADPYSAGCLLAMARPLAIFTACSGYESVVISNGQCSASALAAAASNSAGIAEVMSLVTNSATVTEAIYTYSKLTSGLNTTEFPCQFCLLDLIGNLFNLSAANKAICVAGLTSWDCYMAMGPTLDTFWKCSQGWSSTVVTSIPLPVYVA